MSEALPLPLSLPPPLPPPSAPPGGPAERGAAGGRAAAGDATLARALAGSSFRRADTARDERGAEPGGAAERFLRNLAGWWPPGQERANAIAALSAAIARQAGMLRALSDAELALHMAPALAALKARAAAPGAGAARRALADDRLLAPLLAGIGEAARRRLGLWPHPVQFAAARVLLSGKLAEMGTGEGKTLVAAIAATAMAASGVAVHVIRTNDYLARRDCEEMRPLFDFFGLGGGVVQGGMEADARRQAYARPICYVSGKELVFDYLKDRLAGHGVLPAQLSQLQQLVRPGQGGAGRPLIPALHFAIVDEADSVLIDEARTPMILSREAPGLHPPALLHWAVAAARPLQAGRHFVLLPDRSIELQPGAVAACPPLPDGLPAAWRSATWRAQILRQALSALHLFTLDQHYILADGKVQIVDESTGRVMPDRSWEQGLHQLIEAKEGVALTPGRETLARMTFQRFFRRYYLLAGLTGTAAEAARELWTVYRLPVHRLPPNRPSQRRRAPDRWLPGMAAKWQAVADAAATAAARGQPVLVGTRSVEASEQVAAEFQRRGVAHVVLNARQDAEEAAIVAAAGGAGRITVATNMAGRGTDIRPDPVTLAAGGLLVILTEYHESPRIDRQLFGRSGRQGQPGQGMAIVSAADPLLDKLPALLRALLPLAAQVRWAQSRAERRALRARMQTLKQDRELNRLIGMAGRVT